MFAVNLLRFLLLAGLASVLFWVGYFAWWPAIIPAAAALGLANTGVSGFASPTGALYGQIVNADGKFRTGLGYAEQAAIERFEERAITNAENSSDADLRAELVVRADEIRRLQTEAGVAGFSVARIDISPHGTLYQRIGDAFPRAALLFLLIVTVAACIPRFAHRPVA